jgi:NAD(P)-dependent dehydrogenase (short-subunit alcohol dehydrogenase family)
MTPYHHPFDLTGRCAVVTGGGGILGQGFCRVLASHGARVAVLDVDLACAKRAVQAIRDTLPEADLLPLACDVSNPAQVSDAVQEVVAKFGGIDILHNNAATKGADLKRFFDPFESYSLATWREVMAVNVDGMFLMAQAVGKQMVAQGRGGSIVQTASIYGVVAPDQRIYEGSQYMGMPINTPAVYSASKAAVVGLTKYLASYWGSQGIRVNTLTPGGVESGQNEVFSKRYAARVPLGRMAQAGDMESALLYLASDASAYVTGQNLIVDGGLTCW